MRFLRWLLLVATLASVGVVWVWARHPERVAQLEARWIERAVADVAVPWQAAQGFLERKNWPQAQQALTETLQACEAAQSGDRIFGIWRQAVMARAKLAKDQGEHAFRADLLRAALERDPRNAPMAFALGEALLASGQVDEAQTWIADWVAKLPHHPRSLGLQKQLDAQRKEPH